MSSQTVLLISYHFYPTNEIGGRRTTALARHLVARGLRVIVVSAFGQQEVCAGAEILPGIIAIPVKQPRRLLLDSLVSLKRGAAPAATAARHPTRKEATARPAGIMSRSTAFARRFFFRMVFFVDAYKKWAWRASRAAITAGRKYGARAVVSSSPPKTVLLAGAMTARRLHIPHIADFRDPWTDSVSTDPQHRTEYLLQLPLERWVVHSAASVTSAGAMVAQSLSSRYPAARARIHVVRNGYDGEAPPALSSETGGRLAILFAGDLYLGRDPFPLLRAVEDLLQRPDVDRSLISLTLMGRVESYGSESLTDWLVGKACAPIVRLLPHLPPQAVAEEASRATVLVNLAQQQPYSVPAKTYEHLICGREILLICENDCETAQLVKGIRGVNQVDSRDARALEQTLFDLYRRHAVEGRMTVPTAEEARKFSRETPNEQFWSLIDKAAGLGTDLPREADDSLTAS